MIVKFWGTRGSIPVPGFNTFKYGGNTPCIQITTEDNRIIVLDAGTGIREMGNQIIKDSSINQIELLISHTHWDHIHGIPFFSPLYKESYKVNIYSSMDSGMNSEEIIDAQLHPNFFPVGKEVFKAKIKYSSLQPCSVYDIAGLKVETIMVHHSRGTLAFKITENGHSLIYMTDNEIEYDRQATDQENILLHNSDLINFCKGTDYLIHDSMYNIDSFNEKIGWGHSNNVALTYFSMLSEVKNLILFHYDPDYTDDIIDNMLNDTRRILAENKSGTVCIASKEGLEIKI